MASIYNDLKQVKENLKSGLIDEDEAMHEAMLIWEKSKKGGRNRRCFEQFVKNNLPNYQDELALFIIVTK